jgi:3-hydroxyanthranilate 3,4-dioxygenase
MYSYFIGESTDPLWERWFHLSDVVKDLPPVIKEFNESEAKKTGKPTKDSFVGEPPYKPKFLKLSQPINMSSYIDQHLDEIK